MSVAGAHWVDIKTRRHPHGRRYAFARLEELTPTDLQTLVGMNASAADATSANERRLARQLARAVCVVLPALDIRTARRLPSHDKARIVRLWVAMNAKKVSA